MNRTRAEELSTELARALPLVTSGFAFAENWPTAVAECREARRALEQAKANPLRDYFDAHQAGRGIWKWAHYFDIYHQYFKKFVGREVAVLEIGVYSGGSLEMWRNYFGPHCRVYGVDIEEACRIYETDQVKIFIGDQADRSFWRDFKEQVPELDVVIDDGGHHAPQQIAALEELLPHLRPGGLYLCEDVNRIHNRFTAYVSGLMNHLNATLFTDDNLAAIPTPFQGAIAAIHSYPFVVVIERTEASVERFISLRHGTEWQPFYDAKPAAAGSPEKQ